MTLPDDTLHIETPENVAFGYEVAGIGSRFLAALVDTTLIGLIMAVVTLAVYVGVRSFLRDVLGDESNLWVWLAAVAGLVNFALLWGYYILFEMVWNGQTPGKRWAGLRTIRADGTPITLAESVIRNLLRIIDLLPTAYGVGVVTMFIDNQSRRLGDLAAGTLVVRDRGPLTLESLARKKEPNFFDFAADRQAASAGLPVERLEPADLRMAEDFLRRREQLFNRAELSQRISTSLCERMGLTIPDLRWPQTETLIGQIVQAARDRNPS